MLEINHIYNMDCLQGMKRDLESSQDKDSLQEDDLTQKVAAFMEQHNITDLEAFLSAMAKKSNAQM